MTTHVRSTHKAIKAFYDSDARDFEQLLSETSQRVGWQFDAEAGVFSNEFDVARGHWVAVNGDDIELQITRGAPTTNTLFNTDEEVVLYQDGREVQKAPIEEKKTLVDLLNQFYDHALPETSRFEQVVAAYETTIPELAKKLNDRINRQRKSDASFKNAYESFFGLCKGALYNKLAEDAVDEMLIQHVLGSKLLLYIDENFLKRNPIAREIAKPLKHLDTLDVDREMVEFYKAVDGVIKHKEDFFERFAFVVSLYRRFLQGFVVKSADLETTPDSILSFMGGAVAEVLGTHLKLSLGDDQIVILDPATSLGEFAITMLEQVPDEHRATVYQKRLFANEMMLFPYYFASLHIEHAFEDLTGKPSVFEGLSFADTLDLKKRQQMLLPLFVEENESRTHRQQDAPITVIVGNLHSYAGKLSEHSKRRRYRALKSEAVDGIDDRIEKTYGKNVPSTRGLYDTAARFFRWATDRLGERQGVICFLSDHDFLNGDGFAGMRRHLNQDFDHIYHIDLDGYAFNDEHSGQGITILVRSGKKQQKMQYAVVKPADLKLPLRKIDWQELRQSKTHQWHLHQPLRDWEEFPLLASEEARDKKSASVDVIFKSFGRGVSTRRDPVVYGFQREPLAERVQQFIADYNSEVERTQQDSDAELDKNKILWSASLKKAAKMGEKLEYEERYIRQALYRPFTPKYLYFSPFLNEDRGECADAFPEADHNNKAICYSYSDKLPYGVLMVDRVIDVNLFNASPFLFPFYRYRSGKAEENITDWALEFFRSYYHNETISKWEIFYYIYAVLSHPTYREQYVDQLKQEMPRIPLSDNFTALSRIGQKLADLHTSMETIEPVSFTERPSSKDVTVSYAVDKIRLNRSRTIKLNKTLTLQRVPKPAFNYQIAGRSALEWVIDQYQKSKDRLTGIEHDPNQPDNERAIVEHLGRVAAISEQTVEIIEDLPKL